MPLAVSLHARMTGRWRRAALRDIKASALERKRRHENVSRIDGQLSANARNHRAYA